MAFARLLYGFTTALPRLYKNGEVMLVGFLLKNGQERLNLTGEFR